MQLWQTCEPDKKPANFFGHWLAGFLSFVPSSV